MAGPPCGPHIGVVVSNLCKAVVHRYPGGICEEDDLARFFIGRGCMVMGVRLIVASKTNAGRGFAFVDFIDEASMRRAMSLAGTLYPEGSATARPLALELARERPKPAAPAPLFSVPISLTALAADSSCGSKLGSDPRLEAETEEEAFAPGMQPQQQQQYTWHKAQLPPSRGAAAPWTTRSLVRAHAKTEAMERRVAFHETRLKQMVRTARRTSECSQSIVECLEKESRRQRSLEADLHALQEAGQQLAIAAVPGLTEYEQELTQEDSSVPPRALPAEARRKDTQSTMASLRRLEDLETRSSWGSERDACEEAAGVLLRVRNTFLEYYVPAAPGRARAFTCPDECTDGCGPVVGKTC